jgi:hypothetical protein
VGVVEDVLRAAKAQCGRRDGVLLLGQKAPGLLDRRADHRLGHPKQVGQHLLGAHLPQVDHGDQEPVAI